MKMSRCGSQYLAIPHPPKVVGLKAQELGMEGWEIYEPSLPGTPVTEHHVWAATPYVNVTAWEYMWWPSLELVRPTIWCVPILLRWWETKATESWMEGWEISVDRKSTRLNSSHVD